MQVKKCFSFILWQNEMFLPEAILHLERFNCRKLPDFIEFTSFL